MQCPYSAALSTTPTVRGGGEGPSTLIHTGAVSVAAKDIACKVKEGAAEFRDQVQFKRVEIPDLWSKVQQYKGTFAVSDKL